ncbi:MAG: hypothetical protein ACI8TA_001151 [Cyclobacteriaceae bacterium]|jgi:hypothetical protein
MHWKFEKITVKVKATSEVFAIGLLLFLNNPINLKPDT